MGVTLKAVHTHTHTLGTGVNRRTIRHRCKCVQQRQVRVVRTSAVVIGLRGVVCVAQFLVCASQSSPPLSHGRCNNISASWLVCAGRKNPTTTTGGAIHCTNHYNYKYSCQPIQARSRTTVINIRPDL